MRKIILFMLCLVGVMTLVACNESSSTKPATSSKTTQVVPSTSTVTTKKTESSTKTNTQTSVKTSTTTTKTTSIVEELQPCKLYLVGDSTVCSFESSSTDASYYYPRFGYGTKLGEYLDEKVEVVNYAYSGRSSKDYPTYEKTIDMYETMLEDIQEGDFMLIAFGHNDESSDATRYSNPNDSVDVEGSFKYNLYYNFIIEAISRGAEPILVTPIVRRSPLDDYTTDKAHITEDKPNYPGGDFPQAIRDLAEEQEIPLVDATALTKTLYETVGFEENINYHCWTKSTNASVDNTHLNAFGASLIASIIASGIKESTSALAKYVKEDIVTPVRTEEVMQQMVNPNYVESSYQVPTGSCETVGTVNEPWNCSAIGDLGGKANSSYHTVVDNGNRITVSCLNNKGKISSSADGLVIYYQTLDSSKDFTIEATMSIVSCDNTNNQVAFGVMMRDDMYVDGVRDTTLSSNYVSSGVTYMSNPTYAISHIRKDGALERKFANTEIGTFPQAGDTITVKIEKVGTTYTCTLGDQEAIVWEGLDLTVVDQDNIYVGCYAARNAKIDFTNIKVTIKE